MASHSYLTNTVFLLAHDCSRSL